MKASASRLVQPRRLVGGPAQPWSAKLNKLQFWRKGNCYALLKSTKPGSKLTLEITGTFNPVNRQGFGQARTNDGRHLQGCVLIYENQTHQHRAGRWNGHIDFWLLNFVGCCFDGTRLLHDFQELNGAFAGRASSKRLRLKKRMLIAKKHGKAIMVIKTVEVGVKFGSEPAAEVYFKCLDPNDPVLKQPPPIEEIVR